MIRLTHTTENEQQLLECAAQLAQQLIAPLVIHLQGDLGAGKTTFTRGILKGLGFQGLVKSPTYTVVENYPLQKMTVYHLDLYRLGHPEELEYIGIRDYLNANSVIIVEWPEKGKGFVPGSDISIYFEMMDEGRKLILSCQTKAGEQVLQKFNKGE